MRLLCSYRTLLTCDTSGVVIAPDVCTGEIVVLCMALRERRRKLVQLWALMVRRKSLLLTGTLGIAILLAGVAPANSVAAATADQPTTPSQPQSQVKKTGVWQPPRGLTQIPIWPNGAPDMAGLRQQPESVLTADTPEAIRGRTSEAVYDVSAPTLTVFPPAGRSASAAVIVFPGGGFQALAITIEGTEICAWITSKGMTCILSKYRIPKSNHHYDKACDCGVTPKVLRALQDAQRTIRMARSRAKEWNLDPNKIGVMGFSAGGYLVAQTSNIFEPSYMPRDSVDAISSRPDFAIAFFPGHLCRPGQRLDPGIRVSKKTPPTFLLQAWDDPVDPVCNSTLYARALNVAGVPTEVHLFARGGHAFGLRRRQSPDTVWPALVENWLNDIGILRH